MRMSDADELDDELLAVAGRPRQTPGKRRRQAAEDSDEDGMLSEARTNLGAADHPSSPPVATLDLAVRSSSAEDGRMGITAGVLRRSCPATMMSHASAPPSGARPVAVAEATPQLRLRTTPSTTTATTAI